MYAIVETSGRQFKVEPGATITVDRFPAAEGATVELDRVLLVNGDELKIGNPTLQGAKVTAKVVEHFLGQKVLTFKYKSRKRTRTKQGFRARLTKLEILGIEA